MNITIQVADIDLPAQDKDLIKECLNLSTEDELSAALTKVCKAAFMEYMKMFKEKGLPTRADEVQQERLYFLLVNYFENRLPEENEVSSIFQLTPSQSKTLLRNTKSRYRTKISNFIKATMHDLLESAVLSESEEYYEFVCSSSTTIEELNLIVSQKGPTLEPIKKLRSLASKYSCTMDTYNLLMTELS